MKCKIHRIKHEGDWVYHPIGQYCIPAVDSRIGTWKVGILISPLCTSTLIFSLSINTFNALRSCSLLKLSPAVTTFSCSNTPSMLKPVHPFPSYFSPSFTLHSFSFVWLVVSPSHKAPQSQSLTSFTWTSHCNNESLTLSILSPGISPWSWAWEPGCTAVT